jgi:DNA-binding NarL/FixJ family response regulator
MKQSLTHRPHVRMILLTNNGDANVVRLALDAGASGFVLKVNAPTELVEATRTVVDSGTCLSSAIAV